MKRSPVGQTVDVCGYEYRIYAPASDERSTRWAAKRWYAQRFDDKGRTVWAIIQRRTVNSIRRWAVVEQVKAPRGAV